jgi:ribonuclease BN (tRNA processing enzyme)
MTKLVFLGTKGEIEEIAKKHQYHSSLLVISEKFRLLIDFGKLHPYKLEEIKPDVLLITHAHPDHYNWLEEEINTKVSVYLTKETLNYGKFKPNSYKIILPNNRFRLGPLEIYPYRVMHSIRCPTIGFRIRTLENKTLIYNPDLVDIINKDEVLTGIDYYIGDGSSFKANLVRKKGNQFFGHARITTQINWCKKYNIDNIIFTHLGKETMEKEKEFQDAHPEIILAYDGMELKI